jgi:arylsulfatase A-like enzyme
MSTPFRGVVNLDIRDSVPDWAPYEQPKAPEGSPNVLFIVWDDVGFATFDSFGGPVEAPTMKRLADNGLRYTQFHTTSMCSPTRAALLTGRNHTTVGMGCITDLAMGFPGSNGHIPFETATVAEVLSERGYNTYAVGKWHLTPLDETNMAATKRNWPSGRGFERFYGFLGGETSQYYPDLVQDQQFIDAPDQPVSDDEWLAGEEGYHLTEDLVDRAIAMIGDAKQVAPERPFLMYFCPGAGHAPHQVPKEWADRYRGSFDTGYEAIREQILARQKHLGIVPENTDLSPINPLAELSSLDGKAMPETNPTSMVQPWESLSGDEKRLFARMAEVFAGFVSHTDHHIGRLIDYLEEIGELDNTLIFVISDNGASSEGGPTGSVNENKFFNGVPDDMAENMKFLDKLGSPATFNHYPTGWAMAFNTPFKLFKTWAWEGGVCDPLIVHWPSHISARGEVRDQYHHCTDLVPTVYECLDIDPPREVKGYTQWPLEGTSLKYSFDEPGGASRKPVQFYSLFGTRALWRDGWKVNALHAVAPSNSGHYELDRWALYNTDVDRSECHDLSEQHPDLVKELEVLWYVEAGKFKALPLEDRDAMTVFNSPRPQIARPRDRYVYYPNTIEVPEPVGVNIRGRSYKLAANVDIISAEASGVLFSHGHSFGGHALYLQDGRLKYVYNFLGERDQILTSEIDFPLGPSVLGVEFTMESLARLRGAPMPNQCIGTARLYINDRRVDEFVGMVTQIGKFSLCGEGLNVGLDRGSPVTTDYGGASPWHFSGGTIKRVTADVSGEPYRDFELELAGLLSLQ